MALTVLLDANVLLLFLLGIVRPEVLGTFKRTSAYVPEDFDTLTDLIPANAILLSTAHILTEVSNLIDTRGDVGRRAHELIKSLLTPLPDELSNFKIDEDVIPAKTATDHATFTRLGLTDAAIATVADRCAAEDRQLRVITTDVQLWAHLVERLGDEAINFTRLLKVSSL